MIRDHMDLNRKISRGTIIVRVVCAMIIASVTVSTRAFADATQTIFNSPQAAVSALIESAKTGDPAAALQVLGPEGQKIISSGDPVADQNGREAFVRNYEQMHRTSYDSEGRVILYVGADNWPFPIPIVKQGDGWVFDTAVGEQELLFRRIGSNELYTIATLRTVVEAQYDYKSESRDGNPPQYAPKLMSTTGKHDGLYWPVAAGEPESPIGPLIATATTQGYQPGTRESPTPYHGYLYKILTRQGPNAPGGAKSYVMNGKQTRGFAILAYPVQYRSSGVMTFIVNQDGVVFEKDLGNDTDTLAKKINAYNPDKSWSAVGEYSASD
ncbi:MAG: DUF2950 domain-containing protein [Candidatus Binataceae bacterium]